MGEEVEDPYRKWVEDCQYSSSQEQLFTIIECDLPVNLSYYKYYNPKSSYRGEGSSSSSKNQNGKSPADTGKGLSSPPPRMDCSVEQDDVVVAVDESPANTLSKETTTQVVPIERGDSSSSVFHCALNSRKDIIDLFPEISGEIPVATSKKTGEGFGPDGNLIKSSGEIQGYDDYEFHHVSANDCKKVSSETTQVSEGKSHVRAEDLSTSPRLYAQTVRKYMDHVFKGYSARQHQEVAGEIGNVDILEIAEKRGMKFFRPRWWPSEEEEEEEEEDEEGL